MQESDNLWDYDCPKYDFTAMTEPDEKHLDAYFDFDHELGLPVPREFSDDVEVAQTNCQKGASESAPTQLTSKCIQSKPIQSDHTGEKVTRSSDGKPHGEKVTRSSDGKPHGEKVTRSSDGKPHGEKVTRSSDAYGKPQVSSSQYSTPTASSGDESTRETRASMKKKTPTLEVEPVLQPPQALRKRQSPSNVSSTHRSAPRDKEAVKATFVTPVGMAVKREVVRSGGQRVPAVGLKRTRTLSLERSKAMDVSTDNPRAKRLRTSSMDVAKRVSALLPTATSKTESSRTRTSSCNLSISTNARIHASTHTGSATASTVASRARSASVEAKKRLTDDAVHNTEGVSSRLSADSSLKRAGPSHDSSVRTAKVSKHKIDMDRQNTELRQKEALKRHLARTRQQNIADTSRPAPVRGSHPMQTRQSSLHSPDFIGSLRSGIVTSKYKGLTIPAPFQLTKGSDGKATMAASYKSQAEVLVEFHRKTPQRFHSKRKGASPDPALRRRGNASPLKTTVPHTPQFETRTRSRPLIMPSQEQIMEELLDDMKKNQFKAHGVNEKILKESGAGVKHVQPKPVTHFEPFDLTSDKKKHLTPEANSSDMYHFKARPLPLKILEAPQGIKALKHVPPTVPESPAFTLKNRVRVIPEQVFVMDHKQHAIKSHPVPHTGIPFQPQLSHRTTVPSPFAFQERDKDAMSRKEEKIYRIYEEEKKQRREFRANNMPDSSPDELPQVDKRPATRPAPFRLDTDIRGARKAEIWSKQVQDELQQQEVEVHFKATRNTVTTKEPFIPQKSSKPLTDVSDFTLNTELRSTERERFDQMRQEANAENVAARRQHEVQEEEENRIAVAKLRKKIVHKAEGVRHYQPVFIQPSGKKLTHPESPRFSTRNKVKL